MDAIPILSSSKSKGETIPVQNINVLESQLPDHVKTLAVDVQKPKLDYKTNISFDLFRRAANYIAAGLSIASLRWI